MRAKIPDAMMPVIEAEVVKGKRPGEIRRWLESDHGISVTMHAISQKLRKWRRLRKDITKAKIEEKTAATVSEDVDSIQQMIDEAQKVYEEAYDPEVKLKAIEQKRRLIEMRFNLNGASEPDRDWGSKTNVNVNIASQGPVVLLPPEDPT